MSNPSLPSMVIPLPENDLATLGRIVVMWAQVESVLDYTIQAFTPIDKRAYSTLMGGSMISGKVAVVQKLAEEITNLRTMTACRNLCRLINDSIADRNDAVHGKWGFHSATSEPVAHSNKRQNQLFTVERLNKLHEASIQITRASTEVIQATVAGRGLRPMEQVKLKIEPPSPLPDTPRALPHWPSHWVVGTRSEPTPPHPPLRD